MMDGIDALALGTCSDNGVLGLQQDRSRALDLWIRAAELGFLSHIITWVCFTTMITRRRLKIG
jgi:TPR repeat protein